MFVIIELDDAFVQDDHVLVGKSMIINIIFNYIILNLLLVDVSEVETKIAMIISTY